MSLQAGIVHTDKRPVLDAGAVISWLADSDHEIPTTWGCPGVVLACAGASGSSVIEDARLHVMGEAAISFDGRLDNREELSLLLRHDVGEVAGDAALALAVFLRFGPDGMVRLIGDWSLAIWDGQCSRLVLASDFAGARPLYYQFNGERIVWSTRLRALVDWIGPLRLDDEYIGGFLVYGGFPDLTPYHGIKSVRPGHHVVFREGRVTVGRFWRPPTGTEIRLQRELDYEERLRELFREAVLPRVNSETPVLSELSGGMDSSSIVSIAKHLVRDGFAHPPLFATLSYERGGSLDERFYQAVGEWSGFPNIRIAAEDHNFLSATDTGDALPAFWSRLHIAVAAEARTRGARTLLTGSPGDLIMGNWWDDSGQIAGLIRDREIRRAVEQCVAWSKALRLPAGGVLWRALLLLLPAWAIAGRQDLFSDGGEPPGEREDSIGQHFRKRAGLATGPRFSEVWTEARPERMKHLRGLVETIELRRLQPPEALTHLAYTHPYAHRPLVEYMLSIPADIVCRAGEPRRLMRRAFRTFWAPCLNGRRSKDSFGGVFQSALRQLAPALIADIKRLQLVERGYVDAANLKSRLERLTSSLDCNEGQLRRLILLELWLRRAAARWSI